MALQDLGDVTLQAHLGAASLAEHAALYRQAVALIDRLQRRGAELESDRYLPYRVAFDVEKLTWELEFFVKHFVEGYRGAALRESERSALAAEWSRRSSKSSRASRACCAIATITAATSCCGMAACTSSTFRTPGWARTPTTWRRCCAIRTSTSPIATSTISSRISLALTGRGREQSAIEFRRRFDLMALQRNLKALGTFGYQTAMRRNPVYIQYIPRTLRYARTNLEKHERFANLRAVLAAHIEELR